MLTKDSLRDLASIFSINFMLITVGVALYVLLHDCKALKKKELMREYKMAMFSGILYLVLGVGLYIAGKFV